MNSDVSHPEDRSRGSGGSSGSFKWLLASAALVVVAALGQRYGTHILERSSVFDERFIRVPIDNLIQQGWSVGRAIDFTETKGPAMIWPYALIGAALGGTLNDLRLISVACFVIGVIPLLMIARRCGIAGRGLIAVAGLYALLPQYAVLGQLLMSEPSFVLGSLCLILVFMWSFAGEANAGAGERRIAGPAIFGVLLAILLHNRVHAVAFAAAACLIAFEIGHARGRPWWWSWPWWLACLLAGLSRVPLWIRWGGLVSHDYQHMHQLGGVQLDNFGYLGAAMLPFIFVLLWPALFNAECRRTRWLVAAGAAIGLGLGLLETPSLTRLLPIPPIVVVNGVDAGAKFLGTVSSFVRALSDSERIQSAVLLVFATLGMASLGALAAIAWSRPVTRPLGVVARLTTWSLFTGWAMYGLISGFVFDRYLIPWAALLPIIWWRWLPRWLLTMQVAALGLMLAWFTRAWLM